MSPTPEEAAQFQVTSESGMEREGAGPGLLKGQPHFDHFTAGGNWEPFLGRWTTGQEVRSERTPALRLGRPESCAHGASWSRRVQSGSPAGADVWAETAVFCAIS